jgi:hypothetical protein
MRRTLRSGGVSTEMVLAGIGARRWWASCLSRTAEPRGTVLSVASFWTSRVFLSRDENFAHLWNRCVSCHSVDMQMIPVC